jgi:hypothetical protein
MIGRQEAKRQFCPTLITSQIKDLRSTLEYLSKLMHIIKMPEI